MSDSKTSSTLPGKESSQKSSSEPDEFERLCDEAHKNAKNDRIAVKAFLKKLKSSISEDPDRVVAGTDAVAKLSDALSKSNAQIIQIAQLKLKEKKPKEFIPDDELSDSDTESVFDQISAEESRAKA